MNHHDHRTAWGSYTYVALACLLAITAGCRDVDKAPEQPAWAVDKATERGPMAIRLKVDRDAITLAETLTVVLEARSEEPYEAALPAFGEGVEAFGILDYEDAQPKLESDGKVVRARTYTLEPLVSGEHSIPPMKVVFHEKTAEGEKTHELETEAATIKVASILPEDQAQWQLHDIAPPVPLPRPPVPTIWLVTGVCALVVMIIAALVAWRLRTKRSQRVEPPLPPHEIAFAALEALLAEQLIEQGEIKLFHIRLSDILRRFIEARFGLQAPERTTEEFLTELASTRTMTLEQKKMLREFLLQCDLVKFATYIPVDEEIQRVFDICKQFVLSAIEEASHGAPNELGEVNV